MRHSDKKKGRQGGGAKTQKGRRVKKYAIIAAALAALAIAFVVLNVAVLSWR